MKTEQGQRLAGRYVLEAPIASGGMAEVWRGRDEVLGRPVAVKILHEHLATDEGFLDRFRREAVTAARLSHPSVVRVFDTASEDHLCFIVMELFEGLTLADVLQDRASLPPHEAARIARGILSGLAHAHEHGVVHRDVKPANVLIQQGQVKVADFGIAKAAYGGDLTTTGELLGTARYLAPEQVDARSVDHRADLYAVGILLYEMLTGRTPFRADSPIAEATLRLTRDPRPPGALRAGIPRDLERVVMRALQRDPDDRFQTADEMRGALERVATAAHEAPPLPAPGDEARPPHSFFRTWMLVPIVSVVVAAAVIVVGLMLGRLELGGPLGVRPRDEPGSSGGRAPDRITIQSVRAHDPEGDGGEHDEDARAAADGDGDTFWETEGYESPDYSGLGKSGVGLIFDLGAMTPIESVEIVTPTPGWRFEIRGSPNDSSFGEPFEDEEGESSFVAEPTTTLAFPDAQARYVLVWITELTQVDDGYRARIAEAGFGGG